MVIGNDAYPSVPLRNGVNDANAVARALTDAGFHVDLLLNATRKDLETPLEQFWSQLHDGDVALFYYSGHGVQLENENYLVPVDFAAASEVDAKYAAYPVGRIVDRMSESGTRLNIVVLDACRNNPFKSSRSGAGGLAAMDTGRGTLIAFATAPNRTADDNPRGENGLFTGYMLEAIAQSNLGIEQVFSRARQHVYDASRGTQVPWVVSSVIGDFYFRPGSDDARIANAAGSPPSQLTGASDPRALINDLLSRYRRSYETMNVGELMQIYPTFKGRQDLENRFRDLQGVAMALGNADIKLESATSATATVVYSITYISKTGRTENTKPLRAEFALKKSGPVWLIDSIRFR